MLISRYVPCLQKLIIVHTPTPDAYRAAGRTISHLPRAFACLQVSIALWEKLFSPFCCVFVPSCSFVFSRGTRYVTVPEIYKFNKYRYTFILNTYVLPCQSMERWFKPSHVSFALTDFQFQSKGDNLRNVKRVVYCSLFTVYLRHCL